MQIPENLRDIVDRLSTAMVQALARDEATRALGHRYADGTEALRDVSFRIHHGESVAIVGGSLAEIGCPPGHRAAGLVGSLVARKPRSVYGLYSNEPPVGINSPEHEYVNSSN